MNRMNMLLSGTALVCAALMTSGVSNAAGDAKAEITIAAQHAGLAAAASDLAGVHTHLHHTVNCIEGPKGADYSKSDLNPCANAGSGAIPDSDNPTTSATLQTAVAEALGGISATNLQAAQAAANKTAATLKSIK